MRREGKERQHMAFPRELYGSSEQVASGQLRISIVLLLLTFFFANGVSGQDADNAPDVCALQEELELQFQTLSHVEEHANSSIASDVPPLQLPNPFDTAQQVAIPNSPTALQAVGSTGRIVLGWTDNSNNETGFAIERKLGVGGTWGLLTTVSTNVNAYSNTGLSNGLTYYYRVYAYNAMGSSAFYSNEACGTTIGSPSLS